MGKKGRYRKWWYPVISKQLNNYSLIEKEESIQSGIITNAYRRTVEETLRKEDGPLRVEAIKMVCVNGTHKEDGASVILSVARSTLQRYISDFIYKMGEKEGYM